MTFDEFNRQQAAALGMYYCGAGYSVRDASQCPSAAQTAADEAAAAATRAERCKEAQGFLAAGPAAQFSQGLQHWKGFLSFDVGPLTPLYFLLNLPGQLSSAGHTNPCSDEVYTPSFKRPAAEQAGMLAPLAIVAALFLMD